MKEKINRNLITGFSVSLFLLILSSGAALFSIINLKKSGDWVNHTNLVLQKLEACMAETNTAETNQRGYLLTLDNSYLDPYLTARTKALHYLDELRPLTADNPKQAVNADLLKRTITKRLDRLDHVIREKTTSVTQLTPELQTGSALMQEARALINRMKEEEQRLLIVRTEKMNAFAAVTPVIIIIAGLLAIVITIVFYWRVRTDFNQKNKLQSDLLEKDADITRRINIIQNVATRIAQGDYSIQVPDVGEDGIGSLSTSLNTMARSLDYSFGLLNDKEWTQSGIAGLNAQMLDAANVDMLTGRILQFLASYTGSQSGAIYLLGEDNNLHLTNSYALSIPAEQQIIKQGEGITGQAFANKTRILLSDIDDSRYAVSTTAGKLRPANILALPIVHEGKAMAVIEFTSLKPFHENALALFEQVSQQIGIVISATLNRTRVQEMLEETQALAEELQTQHVELENMNTELEAQSQKLQASEEELKVQQEELLQANQELEERAHMLEERNETIAQRNRDIQKKAEELALSTKYKSEFLANMSHELRTPLNSILLLSRLMSENNEQNLTRDQVEYAQVIQSSGNGLLSLIDEILDLSKIEAGKMDLEYLQVPVAEIADDMKALFTAIAREKKVEFRVDIAPDVADKMETDKLRLEQIVKNLLSNAFKFTSTGSIVLSIKNAGENRLSFAVTDTGIGIAKDKQALIFEAFQQADGSTRRKYGGTGLGLSISRELARLLGGTLSLESEPGKGATFTLNIATDQQTARVIKEHQPQPTPQPVTTNTVTTTEGPEPRQRFISDHIPEAVPDDRDQLTKNDKIILIVEDDTAFAKSLLEYARQKGYKGLVAVRGDDGIRMAHTYAPLAILLDIQLPVKDGWEVMQELKASSQTRHIPVHIMSSYSVKKESLQQGAIDFINKPFAFDQMQQVFIKIEKALKKEGRKVLIVEENTKHATALAQFLSDFRIKSDIAGSVQEGMELLQKKEVDCVILDMGIPDKNAYETLEAVRKNPSLEDVPIIIFTGESLSKAEEQRIKQYADSIVVKTAHSYKRMLDEVSLFLHLMEENKKPITDPRAPKHNVLNNVLSNKTILIADDDVRNIFSLTKSLEHHGVNVISAMDGKEALTKLNSTPGVDLVLMDMMMPEMDGYETTRRIRQQTATKNLPVIAVTAKTMMGDRDKCIRAGASDYISKPVDIDQLLSLLRVWLYQSNS